MRILLFGGSGQLGQELVLRGRDLNFEVLYPVSSEVDIGNQQQVENLVKVIKPDLVINSAAYTAVDLAETEREKAFLINATAAGYIAKACAEQRARLIHISTDYVFGEGFSEPITEESATNPLNVYGESKLAGEKLILEYTAGQALIVRISSLHGKRGKNFVHTMLDLFKSKTEISVVADILMAPTYAGWLAEVLMDLSRISTQGILHACCAGECSWYQFTEEILKLVRQENNTYPDLKLTPCTASDYPRPAKRSSYSVLSNKKLENLLSRPAITWQLGLKQHLSELGIVKDVH